MIGAVRMPTLYFRPGTVLRRQRGSSLLYVVPLLRELIIEAVRLGRLRQRNLPECDVRDLLALHWQTQQPRPLG